MLLILLTQKCVFCWNDWEWMGYMWLCFEQQLNSLQIDELGKLVPVYSVGGLTWLRHAKMYPWQPCKQEPSQQAAPPDTVTLKNSVEQTILTCTWNPLAKMRVGVVGQGSTTIQCTANNPWWSAKLQAKYFTQHKPALPRPMDHPTDHVLPQTWSLTALAWAWLCLNYI